MNRRAYLAAGVSLCLAGCTASRRSDSRATTDGDDESTADPGTEPTTDSIATHPNAAGTDDDFSDLDVWEVAGGTLTADPGRAVVGSQSARLLTHSSEGATQLAKRFTEPRDLSDVVPGVAVAADGFVTPWIRFVDTDGNRLDCRRSVSGELPLMRYNFGIEAVDSTFDETRVREIHLQLWTKDGTRRTVWFDDLHFTPRPETGLVSIQFDDGSATDYTEALPILEEYGYTATTFINPVSIDSGEDWLTTTQLSALDDAGWCIANHTWSHARLPELSRTEQAAEIREGKRWLLERGFDDGADYFAYPYGRYDATTLELVADEHSIGFAAGRPAQGYLTNPRLASRLGEPGTDRLRTALERTATHRGITSVLYHRLAGDDLETFETLVETIHEYESRGELEVVLPSDLERDALF
ncbi:polysaccharide deacetylase family protein [Natronorubrum aibiense]|uniref:Polysaccharide deacetylase family protein n=1 Tax=Natronorubrum aibiense TaxID=348826 RepID=A0A5P9P3B1_9EURY|nr:polysaccharide deacetylase family protein [Natronorubrum aibiense]QFU82618.1 polysaccharide deacetylase family protein [Natronorubrum aibiense]